MKPLALYVHWPFCVSKCPYCDFNSHVRKTIDQKKWASSLIQELFNVAARIQKRPLTSIFFGGGTPSLMPPEIVATLITEARALFEFDSSIEITLEANPNSFDVTRFLEFQAAGVNRISIGIQSFDSDALKFLGRAHSKEEAYYAFESARKIFDRVSFDLIYALPNQTLNTWEKQLKHALTLNPSHLSLYQLTFEEGTVFEKKLKRGEIVSLEEDLSSLMYQHTQNIMDAADLKAYEVSNHAKKNQESRHNLSYWTYQEYMGIGPGAHGRIIIDGKVHGTRTTKLPERWLENVQKQSHSFEEILPLSNDIVFQEALMMGLRLKQGICLKTLNDIDPNQTKILREKPSFKIVNEEGFLECTSTHLKMTSKGMPLLNAVLTYLL